MKKLRKSVLLKYLLSYSGVVLLCCATIGFLVLYYLLEPRKDAYHKAAQEKMETVLQDMDVQLDMFSNIALDVSTAYEFNYRLFSLNKYYEIGLLEVLSKYRYYSPLSERYFLLYYSDPSLVYLPTGSEGKGSSSDFGYYAKAMLGLADPSILRERLLANEGQGLLSLGEFGGSDDVLLLYHTIYTSSISDDASKASLCFIVTRTQIAERAVAVSGGFGERFALYLDGFRLTSADIEPSPDDNNIDRTAVDRPLHIVADMNSDSLYQIEMGYVRFGALFLVIAVFLFLLLAVYVAYQNYRPIRAMLVKYGQPDAGSAVSMNELDNIGRLLESAREIVKVADRKTIEHMAMLKSQMLLLLVNRVALEDITHNLWILKDGLKGPFYSVLCVKAHVDSEEELMELQVHVEEFSDTAVSVYACAWQGYEKLSVILSMREIDSKDQMIRLIQGLYEAKGYECAVGDGGICSDLQEIHACYLKAVADLEHSDEIQTGKALIMNMAQASKKMRIVLEYIKEHYLEWDISLSKVADIFSLNATCLSNTFKQETGINYKTYIIRLRMAEAKRLLRESDMPVIEICQKVGYSNLSHFIKMFKEAVGVTPIAYRQYKSDVNWHS